MNREPEIEALLNAARDAAIHAYEGQRATKENLNGMAHVALGVVFAQVDALMWSKWAMTSATELAKLKCTVRLRAPSLTGISLRPIEIVWDFLETPLRHLQTIG